MPRKINGVKPAKDLSPTVRVEADWKATWAHKYPGVAMIGYAHGRDRCIFKGLIEQLGEQGTIDLIATYFDAVDNHPNKRISGVSSPSVPHMKFYAQDLVMEKSGRRKPIHPRTLENLDEAKKAMGK